ncbi:hypothetical protein [Roseofilum casamattae]|uniref:Uncharacterized protein n=1 Tax=Roseofilum casamattae BLCC-M143 TaxID=3022442 RepID=A0ABT7BYU9_9CYAN|nr:hypothetical protein [Roseofilum casamattae]MDJ1183664.1 hypothetical protein [Roseofilum casamattae BLCC-M143]
MLANRPKYLEIARLGCILLILGGCQSGDPQLRQASQAMAQMATSKMLSRSCFYWVYPEGQPSEYIDYLFSDLGTVEWPIALDAMEAEQMKAIRQTPLPPEVRVSPLERNYPQEKELVLLPDDENGTIAARGYMPDEETPTLETAWPLAIATPDEITAQFCHSNIELGIEGSTSNP